ncbi:MAG: RecB family exonuclease [uncultured Nocardioidaceae bacterium]|uniref:RecB family exonuclease n=1 Tax=uncultured Nocardioidaceae bacterium TaxID=253824 RepID=A0A6J4LDZ4_9ACTN|nr:MAG: RecB family exonuclease [uncultured Nocardioidaceae bacterium]
MVHEVVAEQVVEPVGSLSPSRAGDFMTCPLLYRFRTIDRLPETSSPAAVRGTVVHKVLEGLFDLPALERTPARAADMVAPAWDTLLAEDPTLADAFGEEGPGISTWLVSCRESLERYFALEDPRRLEPADREVYVETLLDSNLLLRGIIDRLDVAPTGEVRIVDYKTGKAPGQGFEAGALFQMKFYALVLWRVRGVVPDLLQLIYLGSGEVLRFVPEERDLLAVERKVNALWAAIARATETGDWRPRRSKLCGWCSHQDLCPEFGGTPPPLPTTPRSPVESSRPS